MAETSRPEKSKKPPATAKFRPQTHDNNNANRSAAQVKHLRNLPDIFRLQGRWQAGQLERSVILSPTCFNQKRSRQHRVAAEQVSQTVDESRRDSHYMNRAKQANRITQVLPIS